jgi:hypothetical protein
MMKTQTVNGVNCLSSNVHYPVTDYRDEQAEEAAVDAGYLSRADLIEMRRAREAA